MIDITKNEKIKNQKYYKIKDIEIGHLVTLSMKKTYQSKGQFWSQEIRVLRKDPAWSERLIGELVFYWFIPRETGEKKEVLFSVEQIYRNYTLHPIIPSWRNEKNWYLKETEEFLKKLK